MGLIGRKGPNSPNCPVWPPPFFACECYLMLRGYILVWYICSLNSPSSRNLCLIHSIKPYKAILADRPLMKSIKQDEMYIIAVR